MSQCSTVGSSPRDSWSQVESWLGDGCPDESRRDATSAAGASYELDSWLQRRPPISEASPPTPMKTVAASATHAQLPTRLRVATVPVRPVPAAVSLPSAPAGSATTPMTTPALRSAASSAAHAAMRRATPAGRDHGHRGGEPHQRGGQGTRCHLGSLAAHGGCAQHGIGDRARDPHPRTTDEDGNGGHQQQGQHYPLGGQAVDHGARSPPADATARKAAAALLTLSSNSSAGTESATIPPPAWT